MRNVTGFAIDFIYCLLGTSTSLWNSRLYVQCHSAIVVPHALIYPSRRLESCPEKFFGLALSLRFDLFSFFPF